jgi:hypothetical protein
MNRTVTPPRCLEAQHEGQTPNFEIVINDRSYFSSQFSENIEPITRLLYKTRRDLKNLHETIKCMEQTERAIEQHLLTKLK